MKKILLTGTYCSKNKGDAAMRIAAIRAIKEVLPETSISVLSPYPELDLDSYDDCPVLKCCRRKPVQAANAIIRSLIWNAYDSFLKTDNNRLSNTHELNAYKEADLIVDLSGDGLTEEYGSKCILAHLVPIVIGLAYKKPVFVCAQTLGPFKKTLPLIKNIFSRTTAITTREKISLEYLQACGINTVKPVETGDMAFLLPPSPIQRIHEIMQSEEIDINGPIIGMSVTHLYGHKLHTDRKGEIINDINTILSSTLDLLVKKLKARVLLISHVTGPGAERDDRVVAHRIRNRCRYQDSISVINGDYSPSELKGIIGLTDMFIGMRMHTNIAALSQCIPTIAIACGPKFQGIMSQAGQGENVLSVPDLSIRTLFLMAERLWINRHKTRLELEQTIPEVKKLSARNISIIKEILHTD